MSKAMRHFLTINRCPNHREFWSITIDDRDADGNGSGWRCTPSKCCRQWHEIRSWELTAREWRELANAAAKLAKA